MSLRARLVVLCACLLALAAGASAVGTVLLIRANDAREEHAAVTSAGQVAQELEATYVAQAASVRAYLLSGDKTSLADYNARRFHGADLTGRLLGLVMDDAHLVKRMNAVNVAARSWRNDSILPLLNLQQATGPSDEVVTRYRDGSAVKAYQTLADRLSTLRADLVTANRRATARADHTREDVARFAIGSVLASVAVLVFTGLLGRLWISRPIEHMARALSSEPTDMPIHPGGPRELARLATDVEALRERARREIDLAARTREGLAQNAALLMSMRAQLETSPENLPAEWSVAGQLVPATGIVAGDCYNVDVLGRDELTIVVVDVAGHGAGSAVVALRANELLRAGVRSYDDPGDAVTWASQQLSDLDPEMFVTAFVGRLDFGTGVLRYVNAGHPPAIVCDGVNYADLNPTGPLIGPFPGQWQAREAVIGPGQLLVTFTDGLIEMRDVQREEFGMDRLRNVLRKNYGRPGDEMVKRTLAEVEAFSDGRAHDDVTLTIIGRRLD